VDTDGYMILNVLTSCINTVLEVLGLTYAELAAPTAKDVYLRGTSWGERQELFFKDTQPLVDGTQARGFSNFLGPHPLVKYTDDKVRTICWSCRRIVNRSEHETVLKASIKFLAR